MNLRNNEKDVFAFLPFKFNFYLQVTFTENPHFKLINIKVEKQGKFHPFCSDKAIKCK